MSVKFFELYQLIEAHIGTSGIQGWSAGEIFPYTISITGNRIEVRSPKGEVVAAREYTSMGKDGDFQQMHRELEQEVKEKMASGEL